MNINKRTFYLKKSVCLTTVGLSKASIYFGNMYQDSSALLEMLDLNMENPIGYQYTLIIIYITVCFLRSNREYKNGKLKCESFFINGNLVPLLPLYQ